MTAVSENTSPIDREEVLSDVLEGLSRPQKALPGKYLWDETGSALFERICESADYYLTRSEIALLQEKAGEIARLIGVRASLVEFGSGASHKVRILLDALEEPARYVAIDISPEYLDAATRRIADDYPTLDVVPVCADYTKPMTLPTGAANGAVLGFFPGSTIGNFSPDAIVAFLERARQALGESWFLLGVDPTEDEVALFRAYGEADGLMAALHKNLLIHLNRLLGSDFDPDAFRHEVRIRRNPMRVEAQLVAERPTGARLDGRMIDFERGESIHTDSSYKYAPEVFRELASAAGWRPERCWLAEDGRFSLHLLRA